MSLPAGAPAIDSRVGQSTAAPPGALPLRQRPPLLRRHVIDCFLEQSGIVGGYNDIALTDPGDVLLRGYLRRAAILPVSTSNTLDWLAAELNWATPGFCDEAPLHHAHPCGGLDELPEQTG
ncbi:MAG: hypothetical protein R6W06_13795 [Prochlorococcaceae cyanobacterium]